MNKKIVLFVHSFPYGLGETFIENEIPYLIENFSDVIIFPFNKTDTTQRPLPNEVTVYPPLIDIDAKKNPLKFLLLGIFNFSPFGFAIKEFFACRVFLNWQKFRLFLTAVLLVRIGLRNKLLLAQLFRAINEKSLLYFYWGFDWAYLSPVLPLEGSATLVRLHGGDLYEERSGGYLPFRSAIYSKIVHKVFISDHGKAYFNKKYPQFSDNQIVSRLGTRDYGLSPYRPVTGVTYIITCSNIVSVKNLSLLVQALLTITDRKIVWTCFGDGVQLEKIKRESKMLPTSITADFRGAIPNKDLILYYKTHHVDLFLNVSLSEGVPVSIMEALSFGIPCYATNVGGTGEILNSNSGKLLPSECSVSELSTAICEFIDIPDKIQLRSNAREHWQRLCSAEFQYKQFVKYLKSITPSKSTNS